LRDHFQEFEISPELVHEMMDSGEEFVLLDVREDWEWEKASLEGAIHIPMAELKDRTEELDREMTTVVYCHNGDKSVDACLLLWEAGFRKIRALSGGIDLWSEVIDPEVPRY
jgi:sulfur-carrier protein adenylyltransferase/sulfurtransferase